MHNQITEKEYLEDFFELERLERKVQQLKAKIKAFYIQEQTKIKKHKEQIYLPFKKGQA